MTKDTKDNAALPSNFTHVPFGDFSYDDEEVITVRRGDVIQNVELGRIEDSPMLRKILSQKRDRMSD